MALDSIAAGLVVQRLVALAGLLFSRCQELGWVGVVVGMLGCFRGWDLMRFLAGCSVGEFAECTQKGCHLACFRLAGVSCMESFEKRLQGIVLQPIVRLSHRQQCSCCCFKEGATNCQSGPTWFVLNVSSHKWLWLVFTLLVSSNGLTQHQR